MADEREHFRRARAVRRAALHGLDHGELYDLAQDPQELTNLWEEPAAALRADLTQRSLDATVAACDPGPAQIGRF